MNFWPGFPKVGMVADQGRDSDAVDAVVACRGRAADAARAFHAVISAQRASRGVSTAPLGCLVADEGIMKL